MATATSKVIKTEVVKEVTLTLNEAEVRTLYSILMKVGGSPKNGPRQHADAIAEAVREAYGIDRWDWEDAISPEWLTLKNRDSSGLYFNDY